jgi:hypothetical protein
MHVKFSVQGTREGRVYETNHAVCKMCYICLKQKKMYFLQHSHEMSCFSLLASDSKSYLQSVNKVTADVIARTQAHSNISTYNLRNNMKIWIVIYE